MIRRIRFWFWLPLAVMLGSVLTIAALRPVWGIDFTGGSLLEVAAPAASVTQVRSAAAVLNLPTTVQAGEGGRFIIRTGPLSEVQHQQLLSALREREVKAEELRFESIGPTIGEELRRKALVAVLLVLIVLIVYLAYTFRGAQGLVSPWMFGMAAVYALLHDLLVVTAVFVILGRWYGAPVDGLFVTAVLAILGYSVNDTIVIFNRLQSEWRLRGGADLLTVLDGAARLSVIRSLNTSLTTLLVLFVLLTFGGTTIRWFVAALTVGTISGTYSSLFVAPPLLYWLTKRRRRLA